uniref:Uncharacterized protein n=1 Tax=Eutreptiella gymnastica TaxID=73025 RepID=A0A7S4LDN1_9EUGL|mmetsp:Transcript_63421/g.102194  ORF Transcript_63421/g.102194 Transcript_63421/m.102194 type:complete len:102 (-) Transcript_63421:370-675(-)|eukprot:CAMPEP_0174302238 /NCGR_PEP_ID=MMETSP0809-20121228/59518_1 /TAXON_ID=73025 ORGANISM="Eutreptiella gymnastica-like, Strain CCMP1594" /NCGR_SAMPLE_ID=MMETSP0809 /ASSEMBLY_ACC=CAM_ASM_000658 /LENGTH=101 /DNA_ID=CAMNT_0015408127 /DNA_START=31 /DNA_END=336 /DNA_ORIENTATION=-
MPCTIPMPRSQTHDPALPQTHAPRAKLCGYPVVLLQLNKRDPKPLPKKIATGPKLTRDRWWSVERRSSHEVQAPPPSQADEPLHQQAKATEEGFVFDGKRK